MHRDVTTDGLRTMNLVSSDVFAGIQWAFHDRSVNRFSRGSLRVWCLLNGFHETLVWLDGFSDETFLEIIKSGITDGSRRLYWL